MAMQKSTRELADLIEHDFLRHGGGNLNPSFDQIARAWQDLTGQGLLEAIDFVSRRWGAAVELLEANAWSVWVPYTARFLTLPDEPDDTDWRLLLNCVVGQGSSEPAKGIHFHVPSSTECWMWLVWRDFYEKVGNGVKAKGRANLRQAIEDHAQPVGLTSQMTARLLDGSKAEAKALRTLRLATIPPQVDP